MLEFLPLWSPLLEMEPPPGHWSRGDGEILRVLIGVYVWRWGGLWGCPGGGWGDKEASYSFPSGQGPGGGVSRPLGKRRRPEPEPLRRRQKGKMEELGPPSAVRNQPKPQEQRERACLQRALQVWGKGGPHGANGGVGKNQGFCLSPLLPLPGLSVSTNPQP